MKIKEYIKYIGNFFTTIKIRCKIWQEIQKQEREVIRSEICSSCELKYRDNRIWKILYPGTKHIIAIIRNYTISKQNMKIRYVRLYIMYIYILYTIKYRVYCEYSTSYYHTNISDEEKYDKIIYKIGNIWCSFKQ